jgi:site-specific DNA recombinase
MIPAAIYARVSSDRQKEKQTIDSQIAILLKHVEENGYIVPSELVFKDEGYSGSTLVRPGLERLRDLTSGGQISTIFVYSPDRLSRKYAYQVLLLEEFSRNGVELLFIKSPKGDSPEEELLLQMQGMIAEYERAQIAERSRRGKRYRAQCGSVSVLSGAPYGYQYIKKTEDSAAYYMIIDKEAEVVREVYRLFTEESFSIGAIARYLTNKGIQTRKYKNSWERSVVWAMLKNPAYKGSACFGKTESVERQKITRPLRQKGGFSPRCSANREKPRKEWIEISVPAIIDSETFEMAQELLQRNKLLSARRTKEPTLLQGLLVCSECGYAIYRTSTRTSKRKIYYYRCFGSDNYRHANGRVCSNHPIRQDYMDKLVWDQIVQLLEDPKLIREEIDKRLQESSNANPIKKRKETLIREMTRVQKGIDRLLDAYQEDLLTLTELRKRIPELKKRESALKSELQKLETSSIDKKRFLEFASNTENFLNQMHQSLEALNILQRRKILRLLVKEIQVGNDTIKIKHSIPVSRVSDSSKTSGYLLRTGRVITYSFEHRP